MNENCLIFFLKTPEAGKVKTRLAADIGDKKAFDIYCALVKHTSSQIDSCNGDINVFFTPENTRERLKEQLDLNNAGFYPQSGENLGEKMKNAFLEVFRKGYKRVLIIGADCPGIDINLIDKGFKCLNGENAVIGPSFDGGYYMIGFSKEKFSSKAFENIKWSSCDVYDLTLKILKKEGFSIEILERKSDIDTFEDLKNYIENFAENALSQKIKRILGAAN